MAPKASKKSDKKSNEKDKRKSRKSSQVLGGRKSEKQIPEVELPKAPEPPPPEPGRLTEPKDFVEVSTLLGGYVHMKRLILRGFQCADRVLLRAPFGNYVLFLMRVGKSKMFFVFDGCTCNPRRFRYYDLTVGTAGLLCFTSIHDVLKHVLQTSKNNGHMPNPTKKPYSFQDTCGNRNIEVLPLNRKQSKHALKTGTNSENKKKCTFLEGK